MKNILIIFCFFFLFINHVSAETITIYGSTGDGHLGTPWGVNDWVGQRMATTGRDVDYTGSQVEVLSFIGSPSSWTSIYRGFLVFDTSVIPDNAIILNASTSVYTNVVHNDDNDANAYMGLYQGMQNSASSIDVGDIDQCSDSLNSPTAGAATIDIDNFSVNTYGTFNLNSTGKNWIDKTGYTKLCLREGHDVSNDQISGGQFTFSGIRFKSADAAGTSTDPYMTIEYSLKPTAYNLQVENQTNPTINEKTPEFSAYYGDSPSDQAVNYQIQVSSSTNFSGALLWDSGKTTMASTSAGTKSSEISYSGSPLGFGHDYYWRIKFWDQLGVEGDWSTSTATFRIQPSQTVIYGSSGDGHLGTPWGVNNWAGQRMATTGRDVDYTGSQVEVLSFIGSPTSWTSIYRGFLVFDTSTLPDNAEILNASTSVYTNVVHNGDNDAFGYIGLYQGMQSSASSIVVGDIDQCSDSLNNPTAGAATIDIDNISANAYVNFGLNSSGKSWIDKIGHTKLCFREGHDAGNDQISGGQYTYSGFRFRSSEASGTSTDPYMKIEYILP